MDSRPLLAEDGDPRPQVDDGGDKDEGHVCKEVAPSFGRVHLDKRWL